MTLLHVPFTGGVEQSTDEEILSQEFQSEISNFRYDRTGRLRKRLGTTLTMPVVGTAERNIHCIGSTSYGNLLGAAGKLFSEGNGTWNDVGDVLEFVPFRSWTASVLQQAGVTNYRIAHYGTQLVVAYETRLGGSILGVWVRTWDTVTRSLAWERFFPGASRPYFGTYGAPAPDSAAPRLFLAIGSSVVRYQPDSATSPTYSGSPTTLVTTVGPMSDYYVGVGRSDNATNWMVVDDAGGGVLALYRVAFTGSATLVASIATPSPSVFEVLTIGNVVFVVWWNSGTGLFYRTYNATTFAAITGSTSISASTSVTSVHIQPDPVPASPSLAQAIVSWSDGNFSHARAINQAGSMGPVEDFATGHVLGGGVTSGDRAFVWVATPFDVAPGNPYSHSTNLLRLDVGQIGGSAPAMPDRASHLFAGNDLVGTIPGIGASYRRNSIKMGTRYFSAAPEFLRPSTTEETLGLRIFEFFGSADTGQGSVRQIVDVAGTACIPGGQLAQWCGERASSVIPLHKPSIPTTIPSNGAGSLTSSSVYRYVAVYEFFDSLGGVHRSTPSEVKSVTLGASDDTVTVTVSGLEGMMRYPDGSVQAQLYRTLAGGSVFYRVSGVLSPAPEPGGTFVDTVPDATLAESEILYVEGGVLFNAPPPASRFGTYGANRLWLGGLFRESRVRCSVELFPGVAAAFPENAAFWVDLPDACTALAAIDDVVVAFTRTRIFLIQGDGPNDQGIGQFALREIASSVGAEDWRGVVSTGVGVFFVSQNGIFLLPRGFGEPIYVGASVSDYVATATACTSVCVVDDDDHVSVRFSFSAQLGQAFALVYSLKTKSWAHFRTQIVPDDQAVSGVTTVNGERRWTYLPAHTRQVAGTYRAFVQREDPEKAGYDFELDGSVSQVHTESVVKTGALRPWGLLARGTIKRIWILVRFREPCQLSVQLTVDGVNNGSSATTFDLIAGSPYQVGNVYRLEWAPRPRRVHSFSLRITDAPIAGVASRGVDVLGYSVEWETDTTAKSPSGRK